MHEFEMEINGIMALVDYTIHGSHVPSSLYGPGDQPEMEILNVRDAETLEKIEGFDRRFIESIIWESLR